MNDNDEAPDEHMGVLAGRFFGLLVAVIIGVLALLAMQLGGK
jgi:hypothetical protein